MHKLLIGVVLSVLAGCQVTTNGNPAPMPSAPVSAAPTSATAMAGTRARSTFQEVVKRVMPVAVQTCRNRLPQGNCSFRVVIDERRSSPPNAFQTLQNGQPVIGFTIRLLEEVRNTDEMAFILGHEAAHHIRGHIPQTQSRATIGAIAGTVLAGVLGADAATTDALQRGGATFGARAYSKEFELDADRLGTIIAHRAGYDPLVGARYFARSADPGDQFLGTHPPNADRIEMVRRTAARLR